MYGPKDESVVTAARTSASALAAPEETSGRPNRSCAAHSHDQHAHDACAPCPFEAELPLLRDEAPAPLIEPLEPLVACPILDDLREAPEIVEDMARKLALLSAHTCSPIA